MHRYRQENTTSQGAATTPDAEATIGLYTAKDLDGVAPVKLNSNGTLAPGRSGNFIIW